MENKLSEIAEIGERYLGSLKDAIKWEKLITHQAAQADFAAETPYQTYLLDTEEDDGNVLRALCWHTFDALHQMGVGLPTTFPNLGLSGEDFYGSEFEYCLVYLAAAKAEIDEKFAPSFRRFRRDWLKRYEKWITTIKDRAFRAGLPLRVELLELVYEDNEDLNQACERESWGFNATRLHPDVYMNELLVGMRVIPSGLAGHS